MMTSDVYSPGFFRTTTPGSIVAAREILARLYSIYPFSSVIDVGCGVGTWLAVAKEMGASKVLGVDGDYVPRDQMLIAPAEFYATNLEEPIRFTEQYDLCVCVEVAEHLLPSRADSLVSDLTSLSDVIAFSAAIPFQGGDQHLNEIWPEHWAQLFGKHGFSPLDVIRRDIWTNRDIPWWYRQNLVIFIRNEVWHDIAPNLNAADPHMLTLIHPESYLWCCRRKNRPLRHTYDHDLDVYYQATAKGVINLPGYGQEYPAPRPADEST